MENNIEKDIPYIAFESEQCRNEREKTKLMKLAAFITVLWFITTSMFVCYLWQYDFANYNYEADSGDSGHAVANGSGEVSINGESKFKSNNEN